MASKASLLLCAISAVSLMGCGQDENSPEMGAVPPKPDPNIVNKMPPEIREQMNNADKGQKDQAAMMKKAADAAKKKP